jgi:hypothetical protein
MELPQIRPMVLARAKEAFDNACNKSVSVIRLFIRRQWSGMVGFRTFEPMEIALYHNLGRLPEPESPHRFC